MIEALTKCEPWRVYAMQRGILMAWLVYGYVLELLFAFGNVHTKTRYGFERSTSEAFSVLLNAEINWVHTAL